MSDVLVAPSSDVNATALAVAHALVHRAVVRREAESDEEALRRYAKLVRLAYALILPGKQPRD